MKDWSQEDRWRRCDTCQVVLRYHDIWYQRSLGSILCEECYAQWRRGGDPVEQTPPELCDDCGNALMPIDLNRAHKWSGHLEEMQLCLSCLGDANPDTVNEAIDGMLNLLKDTENDQEDT